MDRELHILLLEDSEADAELELRELRKAGMKFVSKRVETREAFERALTEFSPDIILSDFALPTMNGQTAVELLQHIKPNIPFILVSGTIGEESSVEMLKKGAIDYILKGKLHRLPTAVWRALDETDARKKREVAEAGTHRQLQRLRALRAIDLAISGSLDLRVTLNVILDQVTTQLGVDAAVILLLNPHTQTLDYKEGRGLRFDAMKQTRLALGHGYAGRSALSRQTITIPDLRSATGELERSRLLREEGFVAYCVAPLITKGIVKGALEIFHRSPLEMDQGWIEYLESLAGQAAIAVDGATLFSDLQRANMELSVAYDATLEGWSRALDLRDKETEGHTERVTELTLRLARSMGVGDVELVQIRRGAILHDVGKLGIPDSILLKAGPLTDKEWAVMKQHPVYAYQWLHPIHYLRPALDIPYCHHEKWDGSGYPRGLKSETIPLAARIFAIVDVWDALRSDRPYRKAWSVEKTREHIISLIGTHFDPRVAQAFLEMEF